MFAARGNPSADRAGRLGFVCKGSPSALSDARRVVPAGSHYSSSVGPTSSQVVGMDDASHRPRRRASAAGSTSSTRKGSYRATLPRYQRAPAIVVRRSSRQGCAPGVLNRSTSASQVASRPSTGTAMSSSRAVVPDGLLPATAVYRPLRMCHRRAPCRAPVKSSPGVDNGRRSKSVSPSWRER